MTRYYEIFFDSDELQDFWGTSEVALEDGTCEICSQSYFVATDDNGFEDIDEVAEYLEENHFPHLGCDDDLLNCVADDTRECIFAFTEIDEDEYLLHIGE